MRAIPNIIIVCILVFFGRLTYAQNLALHKPYTLSDRPNYPTTAPETDETSLTNGKYATPYDQSKKRYWLQKAFLGWNYKKRIKITIDLQEVSLINSVIFSTAANGNVQYFPEHIYVFISKDGDSYNYVGDAAVVKYPPHDQPRRLKLVLNDIHKKTRYVTLVVIPNKDKLFCDEIEVRSDNVAYSNNNDILIADSKDRNKQQLFSVYTNLQGGKINEFNDLRRGLWDEHKTKLVGEHQHSFVVNKVNPWIAISKLFYPKVENVNPSYDFIVPVDGVQYGAFTLTNTSTNDEIFNITGTKSKYFDLFLFTVPFIKDGHGGTVTDPLIPVKEKVQLPPGETKLLFFEVLGKNEGTGNNEIKLYNSDQEIRLNIKGVVKTVFSKKNEFDLNVNVWAYLNVSTLRDMKKKAVKDLEAHHVNTIMIEPWFLPNVRSTDFNKLLNYLKNYDKIGNIFLRERYEQKLPVNFLTEDWKENFKKWYSSLCDTVHKNFPEAKIYFYPYDEISKESDIENYKHLINWARNAVPNIKFVATFNKKQAIDKLLQLVDVGIIYGGKDLFKNIPKTQAEIWTYLINSNSRMQSPYKQYRLMGWDAFYNGRKGIGFWNYSIIEGQTFNTIDGVLKNPSKNYAAIYNGADNSLISSRRWEAFRLGIEDYHILKQHAQKYGLEKTRKLVENVIEHPNNYTLADKVRKNILKKL